MVDARGGRRSQGWLQADLPALGLLSLLPVLLLWPFLFGGHTLYFRDITQLYQPYTVFIKDSLARGQLPFWNPLLAGGYPQLASLEPALFFPGLLLFIALPFAPALTLCVLFSHLLAGWGMFALGRDWGWRRSPALLAALTYAAGGYLVSSSNIYPSQAMAALLPLAILALERAWRLPGRGPALLATAILGLQLATTRPDLTLMEAILLTALASARGRQSASWRPLALLSAAFAAGLLLNAASLLPALEFILNSNRHGGINPVEAQRFSFAPLNSLALFVPWLFGDLEWGADWGRYFIGEPEVNFGTFFLSLYLGWLPWLLLPVAWRSRRPDVALWTGLALLALLLALGRHTPLYALFLQGFPAANLMRYPAKFLWLVSFSLAALAGHGLDELLRRPDHYRWYWPSLAAICLLPALAAASMWLLPGAWLAGLAGLDYRAWLAGPVSFRIEVYMQRLWPAIFPEVRQLCGFAALTACLEATTLALSVLKGRRYAWLLAVLVAADLLYQNKPCNFAAPADFWRQTPALAMELQRRTAGMPPDRYEKPLGQAEAIGTAAEDRRWEAELAATGRPYQLSVYQGQRARLSGEIALQFGLAGVYGGSSINPYYSATYLLDNTAGPAPGITRAHNGLAGMLNVRYLVVPFVPVAGARRPVPPEFRRADMPLVLEDPVNGAWLFENRQAMPRAYFVAGAEFAPDLATATRRLATGQVSLTSRLLLEGTGKTVEPQVGAAIPPVTLANYQNLYVRLEVTAPANGYVVLSDNFYPGWQARLDGRPVQLLRVNVVARGVAVPPGRHTIEFFYLPWTILAGALLSVAGWAWLLVWMFKAR